MWTTGRARNMLVVSVLLVGCFSGRYSTGQQDSSAAGAARAEENKADPNTTGTPGQGQSASGTEKSGAVENAPSITGFQTRVLKEGEKVPERSEPDYEDWSKPELTPGMHMDVVPLMTANRDAFTRQLLIGQWRDMDPIDLWIIRPAGVKNPPVILYLYSYNGSNGRYKNDDFCKFLVKDGFAAVGFVSAVTEERFHDRPMRQTFVSEMQEALGSTVHDVQMILNYLEKHGDFDMQRVGMWGDGSGASVAILAAAVDPRIKTLDLLDPWGDWPDWLAKSSLVPDDRRHLFLAPQFLATVQDLEPLAALPKLNTQKVRLQYIADGIKVTPAIVMQKMEAAAPSNVEIVRYDDTKQFISEVASKGTGFDWIKQKLATTSRAENQAPNGKASLVTKEKAQ